MNPAAPDLEVEAGVLMNIFQTVPGDLLSLVYTTVNFDLMEYAGETVRLRAALARNRLISRSQSTMLSLQRHARHRFPLCASGVLFQWRQF